jgi:hypothetical protein
LTATNGTNGKSTYRVLPIVKKILKAVEMRELKLKGNLSNAQLDKRRENAAVKARLKAAEIVTPRFVVGVEVPMMLDGKKIVEGGTRELVFYGINEGDVLERLGQRGFDAYVTLEGELRKLVHLDVGASDVKYVRPAGGRRRDGRYDWGGVEGKILHDGEGKPGLVNPFGKG